MKTFATRYPLIFAITTTVFAMLCLIFPLWLSMLPFPTQIILGRIAICLFAIALLSSLHWWAEVGFVRMKSWRILLPYLPVFLIVLLGKILEVTTLGIHMTDFKLILLGLIVYLAGGFMEEAIFRGLVLRALLPGGLIKAALQSSLIFALVHFSNLIGGAKLNDTILQVIIAFLAGFTFIAPLAVTHNIWPLVFIHAFNNFGSYLVLGGFSNTAETSQDPTLGAALSSIAPWFLLAIYSAWLLYRKQKATNIIGEGYLPQNELV